MPTRKDALNMALRSRTTALLLDGSFSGGWWMVGSQRTVVTKSIPGLVNIQKTMERSTFFCGKIH